MHSFKYGRLVIRFYKNNSNSYRADYKVAISAYKYWTNILGPFPFSPSTLKSLLTYSDKNYVYLCEGEDQGDSPVKLEDLDGRGVTVNKYGDVSIGHFKKGKRNGLWRWISKDGREVWDYECRDGNYNGRFVCAFKDGRLHQKNYKDHKKHGTQRFWNKKG
jgi:hypothetical protein